MEIKWIPIDQVKPYERNAKKHPEEQIQQIANSLKEFGWQQPIVLDENGVIVIGHGRLLAAKRLGHENVPVIYAEGLTKGQIKALRLADNKLNESGWDADLLDEELDDIFDLDMSKFGFDIGGGVPVNDGDEQTASGFNYREQYGVIVMCGDETEQEKIYNQLTREGYDCRVVAV